jgi:hypothetical protein
MRLRSAESSKQEFAAFGISGCGVVGAGKTTSESSTALMNLHARHSHDATGTDHTSDTVQAALSYIPSADRSLRALWRMQTTQAWLSASKRRGDGFSATTERSPEYQRPLWVL